MTGAVVVAADGAPDDGLGHLSRCAALACALGEQTRTLALGAREPVTIDGVRWEPVTTVDPAGAAVVVLDSYRTPDDLRARLAAATKLAEFDDTGRAIAGRLAIGPLGDDADEERRVAGPRFACLRREYWDRSPATTGDLARVLVTTGGGDPTGAAADYAAAVRAALPDGVAVAWVRPTGTGAPPPGVEVVPLQPSLGAELQRADLVVCGAGMTMVEAAALGRPTIALALAVNQRAGRERFASAGAVATADSADELVAVVQRLARDSAERRQLGTRGAGLVDGRGALRVAERVARLAG